MLLLFIVVIFFILFLVFTEPITIRLTQRDEPLIDIDFLLLKLTLYPSRNKKKKKKKSFLEGLIDRFSHAYASKLAFEYILGHSSLTVHEINITSDSDEPSSLVVKNQNLSTVISIILAYISLKSASLTNDDDIFVLPRDSSFNPPKLDVSLSSKLYRLIISYFVFLFTLTKQKIKRGKRLVGKQNE